MFESCRPDWKNAGEVVASVFFLRKTARKTPFQTASKPEDRVSSRFPRWSRSLFIRCA